MLLSLVVVVELISDCISVQKGTRRIDAVVCKANYAGSTEAPEQIEEEVTHDGQ